MKNILASVDTDKNGAINYSEFIAATMNDLISKDANRIQAAFNFFDKNNDGIIDKDDLKQIFETNVDLSFDDKVIEEVVKEWDYNGDGKIDYKEFYRWMSMKEVYKQNNI